MLAGLPADLGVAGAAFVGTNIDNGLIVTAMVATAPEKRARRIAAGQALGFVLLVVVAAATAVALFEFSTRTIGLLGLVPLALGLRGLLARRRGQGPARGRGQAGGGFFTAILVTFGAGADNLAVYIPLFKVGGITRLGVTAAVFVAGEAVLTLLILRAGAHPRLRDAAARIGAVATPVLYCAIGLLVLWEAGTFSFIG
jgi:cadmium resistance protein CadD (predicted permease)